MVRLFLFLFLFSNQVFLQNKGDAEQTKFDFPGYTLKKWVGADVTTPKGQFANFPGNQGKNYLKDVFH